MRRLGFLTLGVTLAVLLSISGGNADAESAGDPGLIPDPASPDPASTVAVERTLQGTWKSQQTVRRTRASIQIKITADRFAEYWYDSVGDCYLVEIYQITDVEENEQGADRYTLETARGEKRYVFIERKGGTNGLLGYRRSDERHELAHAGAALSTPNRCATQRQERENSQR